MWRNLARLARYRGLIQSLVARELKARYRGSVLGFFWSFINPLILLTIYSVVFATFLPNRSALIEPYGLFLFCGILPWTWFSSSLNEASTSLVAGANLIRKVMFPAEVLPLVSVLSNMVHFLLGLPILAGFLLYFEHAPDLADLLWFPVVVAIQLVFTAGLALMLAALTTFFRDIRDLLSHILTFWFFATPIIYPWFQTGLEKFQTWFKWNPFTHLAVAYQELLFFDGPFGQLPWVLLLGGLSIVWFLVAYWVFDRLRDSYAEVV
jgi:ABC-type polysaccharide/polyol phosphate export permease